MPRTLPEYFRAQRYTPYQGPGPVPIPHRLAAAYELAKLIPGGVKRTAQVAFGAAHSAYVALPKRQRRLIDAPGAHLPMARPRMTAATRRVVTMLTGRKPRGRRSSAYKKKRKMSYKKKRSLKKKGKSIVRMPVNWPPTEMIATFEKQFTVPIRNPMSADPQALGCGGFAFRDKLVPNGSLMYDTNTADTVQPVGALISATVVPTMQNPRNWSAMSGHYNRVQHMKSRIVVRFNIDTTDLDNADRHYDIWAWESSDQDDTNPFSEMAITPASADFNSGAWRNQLMASRRVRHYVMRGSTKTLKFSLDHHADRLGNKIGSHVSITTNHPHGVSHPMDTAVSAYATASHGVDTRINLVWCPVDRQAGKLMSLDIKHYQVVRFYDRKNSTI